MVGLYLFYFKRKGEFVATFVVNSNPKAGPSVGCCFIPKNSYAFIVSFITKNFPSAFNTL